jgi:hypothetical protein
VNVWTPSSLSPPSRAWRGGPPPMGPGSLTAPTARATAAPMRPRWVRPCLLPCARLRVLPVLQLCRPLAMRSHLPSLPHGCGSVLVSSSYVGAGIVVRTPRSVSASSHPPWIRHPSVAAAPLQVRRSKADASREVHGLNPIHVLVNPWFRFTYTLALPNR